MCSYVEEAGILSPWQEGFWGNRSCGRQLRLLKGVMEDAQLDHPDPNLLSVNCKSAFNIVDLNCLHRIMRQLGVLQDAVEVVISFYAGTTPQVTCAAGITRYLSEDAPFKAMCCRRCLSCWHWNHSYAGWIWVAADTAVGVCLTTTPSLYRLERMLTISTGGWKPTRHDTPDGKDRNVWDMDEP